MDGELQPVYEQVMQAAQPEDLFGSEDIVLPAGTLIAYLAEKYHRMKAVTDPEVYRAPEDIEAARQADAKLDRLFESAKDRIRRFIFGVEGRGKVRPASAVKHFEVGANRYYLGAELSQGRHFTCFQGYLERGAESVGEVVIKVAKAAVDSPRARRELRNLEVLHGAEVPQWKHLPVVLDRFDAGTRLGFVLRKISGYPLTEVRRHRLHQGGVDPRHMIWMLDRVLSCLGYVHSQGLVHGSLNPDHILVQPSSHNALIIGWSGASLKPAITAERLLGEPGAFSAPETKHGHIGPWSDIYSIGKVMIWILGGDPTTKAMPASIEPRLQSFLHQMVQEDPFVRPSDAWALHREENLLKDSLWVRKFRHFDMS